MTTLRAYVRANPGRAYLAALAVLVIAVCVGQAFVAAATSGP